MDNKKIVRFELKQMLKERNLTYEEFGKRFTPQLDKPTVSKLVHKQSITFDMLGRIATALDLEPHEMAELIKLYS